MSRMEPEDDLTVAYFAGYEAGKDHVKRQILAAIEAVRRENVRPNATELDDAEVVADSVCDAILARLDSTNHPTKE